MNTNIVPSAVFMGIPARVEAAYPASLRREISKYVDILAPSIIGNWREHLPVIEKAEVIMATWGVPRLTPEFLAAAKNLKAIFYAAGSVKCFATNEAFDRDIVIASAKIANAIPVAEYAAAVIILSLKKFWSYVRITRENRSWSKSIPANGTYRATVGLVSLSATGLRTAELLSQLDCDVIAYDPTVSAESARNLGVKLVSLEEVFRRADVVSVHAPLLPETQRMINGCLLGIMKNGATLINTSRGAVIAEDDLSRVLKERPDLTAVLDVTDPEPPAAQSPLFDLPNVVLTPHISGSMGMEIERMGHWMLEELKAYVSHCPLRHLVTREMLEHIA